MVLLIDDEATIRNIAAQTLQNYGYKVITAVDGAQAVALCAQHLAELQLIVTDMDMPLMDGLTTVRAIRTLAPQMKIIVATGSGLQGGHNAFDEFAVGGFLRKPYNADDLLQIVHQVLSE